MEPLLPKDPKSIGDYTLIGRLGSGGMGIVYIAADGPETVALKVIRETLVDDPVQSTRFAREIEALQKIDSPFVARILNSGVTNDTAWYATEFVNGPDLKSLVEAKGPLSEQKWALLASGLMSGLAAIHAQGIIHRDIKPANIIMAETGPKIIDFGIAQVSDATSVTSTGLVSGSPAWFSPEQIEGKALTTATDLFSAGSVLTYAATGKAPWGDDSSMTKASVYGILVSEPNVTGVSPEQLRMISALLRKEPSDRQFPHELQAPARADSPTSATRSRIESFRNAKRFFGWAAAVSALMGLLIFTLQGRVSTDLGTGDSCDMLESELQNVVQAAQQASKDVRHTRWGIVDGPVIAAVSGYEEFLSKVPANDLPRAFIADSTFFSEQLRVRLDSMDPNSSFTYPIAENEYVAWKRHVKSIFEEGSFCG